MLVLERKINEGIIIGNSIVRVVGIGHSRVKFRINAPGLLVRREELDPEHISSKPQGKPEGWLVLTRKTETRQGFWIGDNVLVKALGRERSRVKVGVQAPPDIRVDREELVTGEGRPRGIERF